MPPTRHNHLVVATIPTLSSLSQATVRAQEPASALPEPSPASHSLGCEIVSWNLQPFSGKLKPARRTVAKDAYAAVITTNVNIMAVRRRTGCRLDLLIGRMADQGRRFWTTTR